MKAIISTLVLALTFVFTTNAQNKAVKTIALEQTPGEFTQKSVTVSEDTYVFEITNNNVDREVGLVLVPKGKDASDAKNHIATAYVNKVVAKGKTEQTKATKLKKGEYVYFCPLNPTPQYALIVE
jgi:hypothetical protein